MEAHLPFVQELAKALFSDDSCASGDSDDSTFDQDDLPDYYEETPLQKLVQSLTGSSGDKTVKVSLFCHLHLPQFIESCRPVLRSFQEMEPGSATDNIQINLLCAVTGSPLFARFLRSSPQASGLFAEIVSFFDRLLCAPDEVEGYILEPGDLDEMVSMDAFLTTRHLSQIVFDILVHVGSSPVTLSLITFRPFTKPAAERYRHFIAAMANVRRSSPTPSYRPESKHRILLQLLTNQTTPLNAYAKAIDLDCIQQGLVIGHRFSWDHCAGRTKDSSDCIELKAGQEMMCCSRCHAVRYCSRAHQKAHRNRGGHKEVCREPLW